MQDADDPHAALILEVDEGGSQHSSLAQAGIGLGPQAAAPFGLDRLRVPDLSFSACQPVLDVATQLLKLQQPQLILLLHQPQRFTHHLAGGGGLTGLRTPPRPQAKPTPPSGWLPDPASGGFPAPAAGRL